MTLTLDRLRADVAEVLDMAPEEIAPQDNLFDLGLDSMRLMALVRAPLAPLRSVCVPPNLANDHF